MHITVLDNKAEASEALISQIQTILTDIHQVEDLHFSSCCNAFALVTQIFDENKGDMDIIFARVNSDKDDNIHAVQDIQNYYSHIQVIFYGQNDFCIESIFQAIPTYYLKYPIANKVLKASLQRALKNYGEDRCQTLKIRSNGQLHRIRFSSIKYIESKGRKLEIFTSEDLYSVNMTMDEMLAKLPENFIQTHRSYIVNSNKIVNYYTDCLELSTHERIPVSRTCRKDVLETIKK